LLDAMRGGTETVPDFYMVCLQKWQVQHSASARPYF